MMIEPGQIGQLRQNIFSRNCIPERFAILLTVTSNLIAYIRMVTRIHPHINISNQIICSFQEFAPFCRALYCISSLKYFAC
jgi:hypothetical protein